MGEPGLCSRCEGVDAEDLPAACTLLEGGPCSACKERADIQSQIKRLEEDIFKLKEKRHALGTTMNEIHEPFIHKLPPEIGSHIFYLCLPSLDSHESDLWSAQEAEWNVPLRLGAVCRKWREVAWATPNLWVAPLLEIKPSTAYSLANSLPSLFREWLGRSGLLPLTIFFFHAGYYEHGFHGLTSDNFLKMQRVEALKTATDSVIQTIKSQWSRVGNLYLDMGADMFERFSGCMQPSNMVGLELIVNGNRSPTQNFIAASNPTYLALTNFAPTSIDIGWDNVTRAVLARLDFKECVELLRRAPALEYCKVYGWEVCVDDPAFDFNTVILHPRLRSLDSEHDADFLGAINAPSLEEWMHDMGYGVQDNCVTMISLLNRSNCSLKILNLVGESNFPKDLCTLLQATPSLERLFLAFEWEFKDIAIMDDIFTRLSCTNPNSDVSSGATSQSFLPHLQSLDCGADNAAISPFTWDRIPQLYHQGHRRSLTLKSWAHKSHISDETALELLHLIEEGVDLQIYDLETSRGFFKNFGNRMREESR